MPASVDSFCQTSSRLRWSGGSKRKSLHKADSTGLWGNDLPGIRCTTEAPICNDALDADDLLMAVGNLLSNSLDEREHVGNIIETMQSNTKGRDENRKFASRDEIGASHDTGNIDDMIIEIEPRLLARAKQMSESPSPLLFRMGILFPTIRPSRIAAEENEEASRIPSCRPFSPVKTVNREEESKKRKN
mmetsp:Transcript_68339/g.107656  ORF Transcript_68339/g.107656 Transcript_68339/m.107656 type:complete len:189 (-) Transcript_68339:167-733(-)